MRQPNEAVAEGPGHHSVSDAGCGSVVLSDQHYDFNDDDGSYLDTTIDSSVHFVWRAKSWPILKTSEEPVMTGRGSCEKEGPTGVLCLARVRQTPDPSFDMIDDYQKLAKTCSSSTWFAGVQNMHHIIFARLDGAVRVFGSRKEFSKWPTSMLFY